jgi:hypothetical protein
MSLAAEIFSSVVGIAFEVVFGIAFEFAILE